MKCTRRKNRSIHEGSDHDQYSLISQRKRYIKCANASLHISEGRTTRKSSAGLRARSRGLPRPRGGRESRLFRSASEQTTSATEKKRMKPVKFNFRTGRAARLPPYAEQNNYFFPYPTESFSIYQRFDLPLHWLKNVKDAEARGPRQPPRPGPRPAVNNRF
ncbi:hypothetical protein EVAR_94435_1 [Eumeta japonica]|uniref:Uncharacterized protein n=1 Tax=Eumeta variegata TaxID=151549 RepID=A0A4C1TQ49_EUMVA|nr:hypothetical protein EVAR_94435_1 [Eumeta japonica]